MIRFSVIIVSFNAMSVIDNAIKSVLEQEYDNYECWVIDGESTDGTVEILEQYKADEKFHFLSEKDKGIYDAMNKGYKLARGEWILYLGADDKLESDVFLKLNHYLNENVDLIYGNYSVLYPSGKKKKSYSLDYRCITYKAFTNHQAVLMRKSVIDSLGGFDCRYQIVADFDLIQRCYLLEYKFLYVPIFISIFSLSGISSNNFATSLEWGMVCKHNKSIKYPLIALCYALFRMIKSKILLWVYS